MYHLLQSYSHVLVTVFQYNQFSSCLQELDNFCNPIIYKPKPKVDVAEDKAKDNNEHNGPMDGQSGAETKPDSTKDNSQHTKSSAEMEVD